MPDTAFDIDAIVAGEPRVLRLADGAVVHRRGDAGDCAYIVKRGRVEIRQKGRQVETLSAGEIFGEMGMIDGRPRHSTAVAVGDVELVPITRSLFTSLVRDDEDFVLTILRLLARRHRATMALFESCVDDLPEPVGSAA